MFPCVEPEYLITEYHIVNLLLYLNYTINKSSALYYIIKSINARKKRIWTKWRNHRDCDKLLDVIYDEIPVLNYDNATQVIS